MIQPSTLKFLADLAENNNREWFNDNKPRYQEAKEDVAEFATELSRAIASFDSTIKDPEAEVHVFRIYRDVRFSKDKSPYKLNLGATIGFKKLGEMSTPGYYLQIMPGGGSAIAGGIHEMSSAQLAIVREYISEHYHQLEKLGQDKDFKKYFDYIGDKTTALKTVPRGYDKDHPAREFLRQKSLTCWHQVSDSQVKSKDFLEYCQKACHQIFRLNEILAKATLHPTNSSNECQEYSPRCPKRAP